MHSTLSGTFEHPFFRFTGLRLSSAFYPCRWFTEGGLAGAWLQSPMNRCSAFGVHDPVWMCASPAPHAAAEGARHHEARHVYFTFRPLSSLTDGAFGTAATWW